MQVSKWGNSLAVRLPRKLVEEMRLKEGDAVELRALDAAAIGLIKAERQEAFLAGLRKLQRPTPPGFAWSRDEANQR